MSESVTIVASARPRARAHHPLGLDPIVPRPDEETADAVLRMLHRNMEKKRRHRLSWDGPILSLVHPDLRNAIDECAFFVGQSRADAVRMAVNVGAEWLAKSLRDVIADKCK